MMRCPKHDTVIEPGQIRCHKCAKEAEKARNEYNERLAQVRRDH